VEAVLLDGRPYPADGARHAAATPGRRGGALEFRFAAPSLAEPGLLAFRHRLVGYDTAWSHVGARRAAYFTGVPGGRYRFEVQASRDGGAWSPAGTAAVALQPRLVERPAVRALAALLATIALLAAGALLSRRRTRLLRARAAELAAQVEERTRALHALNGELEQRVAERTAELRDEHAERLRLQEDLQQAQKLDSVGRLAGGIAHDLNNMLTAMLTFAQLAEDASADPEQRADIREIRAAGRRATNLTQKLLTFARRQVVDPQVLDLRAVVRDLATMLRGLLGGGIEVVIRVPDQLSPVLVDPSQVEQVLVNLAVNARDAMPAGGRLVIELADGALDEHAAARLALAPGEYVRLTVADSGAGMPPEVLSRVFEPFFTTKEQGKGTGLGLPTCHGIVAQAGGAIDLSSEVGQGTRLDVWLPRHVGVGAAAVAATGPALPPGRETVLLVDDEAPVRAAARRVLERCGYTVLEAVDGEDALRVAATLGAPPALLLCDVVMPRLGGVELARTLRARWPEVRVLLVSGYVERALPPDAATAGAFLRKPFTRAVLARRVREGRDAAPDGADGVPAAAGD
jgi:signal transduction histidine kinase/CheY-like chemotaxis protein